MELGLGSGSGLELGLEVLGRLRLEPATLARQHGSGDALVPAVESRSQVQYWGFLGDVGGRWRALRYLCGERISATSAAREAAVLGHELFTAPLAELLTLLLREEVAAERR